MRRVVVCAFLFGLACFAQSTGNSYNGHGYLQLGAGGCSVGTNRWFNAGCGAVLEAGGGGEWFLYRGLSAGVELGYGWINEHAGDGAGILSINPAYHFTGRNRKRGLVPFVTGGYTGVFRSSYVNGVNGGGGVTWWAGERLGVRAEGRFHHFSAGPLGATIGMIRVGLAFR
jgi:hypothetical protein